MRKKRTTLLLIARDRLIRADCVGAEVTVLWQQKRPDADDPGLLVEAAFRLGPRRNARVFVLTADAWTQTLSLEGRAAAGASTDELCKALAFEAEPFSGIGAFDSVVGLTKTSETGGQQGFWITQLPDFDREQMEAALTGCGARLAGICHPGGVPLRLSNPKNEGEIWERVEFWSDTIACLRGAGERVLGRLVVNSDVEMGLGQADEWFADFDDRPVACELLSGDESSLPPLPDREVFSLDDDEALRNWLGRWATAVQTPQSLPLVGPTPKETSPKVRAFASAALCVVAFFGCWSHARWINQQEARLKSETATIEKPGKELTKLKSDVAKQNKANKELESDVAALRLRLMQCEEVVRQRRVRFARLMQQMSALATEDIVIDSIGDRSGDVSISGISLTPGSINLLAKQLESALDDCGWKVLPAKQQAQNSLPDGGPWVFEIVLKDAVRTAGPSDDRATVASVGGRVER